MIRTIKNKVWVFDIEWVPDTVAGKLLYDLPEETPDEEVLREMWKNGGATEDNPMPFLKTTICKILSLSMVTRHEDNGDVQVRLHSLPSIPVKSEEAEEKYIIQTFLNALGKAKPQIVGYNSISADLKILVQRGIANGISAGEFCTRPDKPWEDSPDYYSDRNDYNVDLMRIISGWGKSTPSLNEIATVSGIPGKLGVTGDEVAPMWLDGRINEIIAYNEFDALTTYLVWLRMVHFSGLLSSEQYKEEQDRVEQMLVSESKKEERRHLSKFLEEWKRLRSRYN